MENSNTTIGRTVIIKGELSGEEALIIEGRVEGRITLQSSVYVRDTGIVNADIVAQSITIEGSVTGNISATEKVEILPEGVMVGDIKAPRVVLNDGALLKGQIEMEISEDKIRSKRGASEAGAQRHGRAAEVAEPEEAAPAPPVNLFRR